MSSITKVVVFILLYIVWVMVALAGSFGIFTTSDGNVSFFAIIIYLVLIMIPVWLFTKWFNGTPAWVKKVEAEGKQAPATILSVKDTGMLINRTIEVIRVKLRVEPPNDAPFEVSQEKRISFLTGLGGYSAGAHVKVKYDPDNKNHVVILGESDTTPDYQARPSSASAEVFNANSDVTHNLAELSKLHKSGELSDSEYAAAKKKLLG